MTGSSRISEVLDHLAWLREQLGATVNEGNAYAGALLAYNAAAALQWHFVLPSGASDVIEDAQDRGKAAKLIDDFVWRVRDLFGDAKQASKKVLAGKSGKTLLSNLRAAIGNLLRRLPGVMQLPKPEPRQMVELFRSLDPQAMLRDWLAKCGLTEKSAMPGVKKAALIGPRAALRSTLAAASALSDENLFGARGKDYRKGSAEVVAAMLRHALPDYVASLSKKSAKRTEALVQDIIWGIDALQ